MKETTIVSKIVLISSLLVMKDVDDDDDDAFVKFQTNYLVSSTPLKEPLARLAINFMLAKLLEKASISFPL